jgi:hypothetical protein
MDSTLKFQALSWGGLEGDLGCLGTEGLGRPLFSETKESTLYEWKAVSYCVHLIPLQTLPNCPYIKLKLFTAETQDAEHF